MKTTIILLTTMSLLTACKKEGGPTIFEGIIVSSEDISPFVITVYANASKYNSIGVLPQASLIVRKEQIVSDKDSFILEFEENSEIDFFDFGIHLSKDTIINNVKTKTFKSLYTLECSPYNCREDFKPEKAYRDMIISVSK